jgi:hypothetical protein
MSDDPFSQEPSSNLFDLDSIPSLPRTPISRSPFWMILAIVEAALLVGCGIFFGIYLAQQINSPKKLLTQYYAALQAQDVQVMDTFIDPEANLSTFDPTSIINNIINTLNVVGLGGSDANLTWVFEDLVFTKINQSSQFSNFEVTANIHVIRSSVDLGISIPYKMEHKLVKRNGQWYLEP